MKNQPNQTSEVQMNLSKFEELANSFIKSFAEHVYDVRTSDKYQANKWTDMFKNFIFADQMIQQKRKQEYFKLKEQLESMKAEFEPELVEQKKPTCIQDMYGDFYEAIPEISRKDSCSGCAFENDTDACDNACEEYDCTETHIVWIKIKS